MCGKEKKQTTDYVKGARKKERHIRDSIRKEKGGGGGREISLFWPKEGRCICAEGKTPDIRTTSERRFGVKRRRDRAGNKEACLSEERGSVFKKKVGEKEFRDKGGGGALNEEGRTSFLLEKETGPPVLQIRESGIDFLDGGKGASCAPKKKKRTRCLPLQRKKAKVRILIGQTPRKKRRGDVTDSREKRKKKGISTFWRKEEKPCAGRTPLPGHRAMNLPMGEKKQVPARGRRNFRSKASGNSLVKGSDDLPGERPLELGG